jgi:hypothetical protein
VTPSLAALPVLLVLLVPELELELEKRHMVVVKMVRAWVLVQALPCSVIVALVLVRSIVLVLTMALLALALLQSTHLQLRRGFC